MAPHPELQLRDVAVIELRRVPGGPAFPSLKIADDLTIPPGPSYPDMIVAEIEVAVRDGFESHGDGQDLHRRFTVRIGSSSPDEGLASAERRALEALSSELRSLADALAAEARKPR